MDNLRTQQKAEALNRLRILQMKYGLMENVINEFDKEDVIYSLSILIQPLRAYYNLSKVR